MDAQQKSIDAIRQNLIEALKEELNGVVARNDKTLLRVVENAGPVPKQTPRGFGTSGLTSEIRGLAIGQALAISLNGKTTVQVSSNASNSINQMIQRHQVERGAYVVRTRRDVSEEPEVWVYRVR
jgi:hypothetical protein